MAEGPPEESRSVQPSPGSGCALINTVSRLARAPSVGRCVGCGRPPRPGSFSHLGASLCGWDSHRNPYTPHQWRGLFQELHGAPPRITQVKKRPAGMLGTTLTCILSMYAGGYGQLNPSSVFPPAEPSSYQTQSHRSGHTYKEDLDGPLAVPLPEQTGPKAGPSTCTQSRCNNLLEEPHPADRRGDQPAHTVLNIEAPVHGEPWDECAGGVSGRTPDTPPPNPTRPNERRPNHEGAVVKPTSRVADQSPWATPLCRSRLPVIVHSFLTTQAGRLRSIVPGLGFGLFHPDARRPKPLGRSAGPDIEQASLTTTL